MVFAGVLFAAVLLGVQPSVAVAQVRAAGAAEDLRAVRVRRQAVRAAGARWRDRLLQPIEVNGQVISTTELRREVIVLGGSRWLPCKVRQLVAADCAVGMIAAGTRPAQDFVITEADVAAAVARSIEGGGKRRPPEEFWPLLRLAMGTTEASHRFQRRCEAYFDRVFLPGPADRWPAFTMALLRAGVDRATADDFIDGLIRQCRAEQGRNRELPAFWVAMLRQLLWSKLMPLCDIRYPSDGLPTDVVVAVNGLPWRVDVAFRELQHCFTVQDLDLAVRECVIRTILRDALLRDGRYLDDRQFRAAFAAHFPTLPRWEFEKVAVAVRELGYPSVEVYRHRWRLLESFARSIAAEVTDGVLRRHLQERVVRFGHGTIDVDLIPFLAVDPRTGVRRPDGMDRALERAQRCRAAIVAGRQEFEAAMVDHGEFLPHDTTAGRHQRVSYVTLRRSLQESEFTDLSVGFSLARFAFDHAARGAVVGPLPGVDGCYLLRVRDRWPGARLLGLREAAVRQRVRQDYVQQRFLRWAEDRIASARIR